LHAGVHVDAMQWSVPFAIVGQMCPQLPQLLSSLRRSSQAPVGQSVVPASLHPIWHFDEMHSFVAPVAAPEHLVVHVPQ
jgi:hypothetical protein